MFKLFLVLVRVGGVVIFGKAYLYNVGVIDTIHGNLHLAGAAFVEKEPLGHVGRRHHRRKRRRLHLVGVGEYLLRVQLRRLLRLGRRRDRRLKLFMVLWAALMRELAEICWKRRRMRCRRLHVYNFHTKRPQGDLRTTD